MIFFLCSCLLSDFIKTSHYREWFLVNKVSEIPGSSYLTNDKIIGRNLLFDNSEEYREIIKLVIKQSNAWPSLHNFQFRYFLIN